MKAGKKAMTHATLKRFLSRAFLPSAVLFPLVLFTGATFLPPQIHSPLPMADPGMGFTRGPGVSFPVWGNKVTPPRNPLLQRMEEMILTERKISVSA